MITPLLNLLIGCLPGVDSVEQLALIPPPSGPAWGPLSRKEVLPPDTLALERVAVDAARRANTSQAVWGVAPLFAPLAVDARWVPSLHTLERESPDPQPTEAFHTLLARRPWAVLGEDGALTVHWETRSPTPRGLVYLGLRHDDAALELTQYRKVAVDSQGEMSTSHQAVYALPRLLDPSYDRSSVAQRGYGEVDFLVEIFDPEFGSTNSYTGRVGFRIEDERWIRIPSLALGPAVDLLTTEGMVISFETDVPTVAAIAVGGHGIVVSAPASRRHEVAIGGLEAGARHAYQVAVSDGTETGLSAIHEVQTRATSGPVRLAISSDSRAGPAPGLAAIEGVNALTLHPLMVDAVRRGAEAVIFPGDLFDGYVTSEDVYDAQLRSWLRAVEGVHAGTPIYAGMGNHETLVDAWTDRVMIDAEGERAAEARFAAGFVHPTNGPAPEREGAPPYTETVYSVDFGPVHVVMLNTNYWWASAPGDPRYEGRGNREGFLMPGQLEWLEADLTAARQRGSQHIVVAGHEPAFPVGRHLGDAMWWDGENAAVNAMRERFWRMLARYDVLAYVAGDEHSYSRAAIGPETVSGAEGMVWSVISGGAGAPYYALNPPAAYADRVEAFSARPHYTLWTFDGPNVRLEAISLQGETLDDVWLRREEEP